LTSEGGAASPRHATPRAGLGVPVSAFYEDKGSNGAASSAVTDLVEASSAARLLRSYTQIADPKIQQALIVLAESMAGKG
jgi:hypothetical protein